ALHAPGTQPVLGIGAGGDAVGENGGLVVIPVQHPQRHVVLHEAVGAAPLGTQFVAPHLVGVDLRIGQVFAGDRIQQGQVGHGGTVAAGHATVKGQIIHGAVAGGQQVGIHRVFNLVAG